MDQRSIPVYCCMIFHGVDVVSATLTCLSQTRHEYLLVWGTGPRDIQTSQAASTLQELSSPSSPHAWYKGTPWHTLYETRDNANKRRRDAFWGVWRKLRRKLKQHLQTHLEGLSAGGKGTAGQEEEHETKAQEAESQESREAGRRATGREEGRCGHEHTLRNQGPKWALVVSQKLYFVRRVLIVE